MWKNQKIAAGGGQILKRLRINNINFLNSVRRKAEIYDGKTQRYVLKQYHKIRSIEGISTVRVPFRQSGCWSSRGQKESTDVLVLFCNTGRLLCYITLNLGSTSPMRILGYRKLPLNSGCWDEMNPSCFRMAAVSASRLLPSSQYANYAVAVDVLSTAKALLHNQSCHASLLRKLNAGLSCKTLPSDEETDMSYDTPEILSCGEDSDGFNSHDDVASFKFKREQRSNSDDDDADEDGLHCIEQHRSFQMFFPDFDDANPRPNEKTEGFGRASEGDNGCFFDDEAKATAPRVFAFNEHVCVAAYGDGSLRLQTMLPNFTDKSSLLAARCSSTVIPHPPPLHSQSASHSLIHTFFPPLLLIYAFSHSFNLHILCVHTHLICPRSAVIRQSGNMVPFSWHPHILWMMTADEWMTAASCDTRNCSSVVFCYAALHPPNPFLTSFQTSAHFIKIVCDMFSPSPFVPITGRLTGSAACRLL